MCDTIDVPEEHRSKGIATYLYDLAEQIFEVPAEPSSCPLIGCGSVLGEAALSQWQRREVGSGLERGRVPANFLTNQVVS